VTHPLISSKNVPYIIGVDVHEIGLSAKMARYLQRLTFELFCDNLSDSTFMQIVQHDYPALTDMTLGADGYCAVLTDVTLRHMGQRAPNLRSLRLVQSPHFTNKGVRDLTAGCSKLEDIRLLKTGLLGDAAVDSIAHNCPHLSTLHISHNFRVTGASLANVLRRCRSLKELELSNCKIVLPSLTRTAGDLGTDTDTAHCGPGGELQLDLEALVLNSIDTLSDATLGLFLPSCQSLRALKLIDTQTVTDAGALSIAANLKGLTSLTIDCCYRLTSAGLVKIISAGSDLRTLRLHSCAMSVTVLESISASCKGLEELRMTWSKDVTDVGLLALARGCPSLRSLYLNGCESVTYKALLEVAVKCPALALLNVPYCKAVNREQISALQNRFPGLTIYYRSVCSE